MGKSEQEETAAQLSTFCNLLKITCKLNRKSLFYLKVCLHGESKSFLQEAGLGRADLNKAVLSQHLVRREVDFHHGVVTSL